MLDDLPRSPRLGRRAVPWAVGLLLGALAGAPVSADVGSSEAPQEPAAGQSLRLSGFGTLGVAGLSGPEGWGYRRELTQPGHASTWRADIDSRLGVQLNYAATPTLELVGQVIAKKRGAFAADTDAIEWAYASYRPDGDWTLRVGRVNVDAFLMADYRNVGFGFLTARPPVELYARQPTTLDGADAARSWWVGDAQWRVKVLLGNTRIGDNNFSKPGRLNGVHGAMVSREEGPWLLRASAARGRVNFDLSGLQPALATFGQLAQLPLPGIAAQAQAFRDRLSTNDLPVTFTELGARYETADWQGNLEFVRVAASPLTVETTAYLTVGRRFGAWTPYVSLSRVRNGLAAQSPPAWQASLTPVIGASAAAQAQQLADAATAVLNGGRIEQSSNALGVRWDVHPQAAVKLQWDQVRVPFGGGSLWTGADSRAARARLTSLVLDFIF